MGLPRSRYVREGREGVYHCFSRCVRGAYLYGYDALTQRDFSHRKVWLVNRLRHLAAIFAVEVCAYVVMGNHYHTILRTRPDIAAGWSDWEVAERWLRLFPRSHGGMGAGEERISALACSGERIKELRGRLCRLSWFMGCLNEFIARAANKEEGVKGRFWESRFKCQALLDEAAIAACMAYVDLNPIRAGLAATLEGSDYTSIKERIRAWRDEMMGAGSGGSECTQGIGFGSTQEGEGRAGIFNVTGEGISADSAEDGTYSGCWLCPIESDFERRGVLQMTTGEYIDLVDRSGRIIRTDKRGVMDAGLEPILVRVGANPEAWFDTVSRFGSRFRLAAGLLSHLRDFADQLGKRWIAGLGAAREAFGIQPLQSA